MDITNYITIDLNRPLHVFDARKLRGNITVRGAKDGEKFKALNGKEYALQKGMTVIADDSGALSLGGIIGGESTGCTPETTDVFLEVALFEPAHIAKTGRELQIDSDARYRFERGVDPAFVETGAKIALKIDLKELCGGEASELVIAGKMPAWKRDITFHPERIKTLRWESILKKIGLSQILTALGFTGNWQLATGNCLVTPPSWRADVEGEADLNRGSAAHSRLRSYTPDPLAEIAIRPIGKPALNARRRKRVPSFAKRLLAARGA